MAKERKSPTASATDYDVGYEAEGNDGNIWCVKSDKNGKKTWRKVPKEKPQDVLAGDEKKPAKADKKRKERPSPTESATDYDEGHEMMGGSGDMYVVKVSFVSVSRICINSPHPFYYILTHPNISRSFFNSVTKTTEKPGKK